MSTTTTGSLSRSLADGALNKITARLRLTEVHGADGGAYLSLKSPASPAPVGWVRIFNAGQGGASSAAAIDKVVNIGLEVPQFGLDSHMLFAFTKPESAIPHFTLDSVRAPGMHAFHLDLIPRVDLGANLAYMDAAYGALTPVFTEARTIEGLTMANLSPRQLALMSPWMLANRATEDAFKKIGAPVEAYLQHWFGLLDKGLPAEIARDLQGDACALRDRRYRAALFNPEVDPVWNQVDRLVGGEMGARLRTIMMTQGETAA